MDAGQLSPLTRGRLAPRPSRHGLSVKTPDVSHLIALSLLVCSIPWLSLPVVAAAKNPEACLEHLDSSVTEIGAGLALGRVFWDGEIIEPVLIRMVSTGDGGDFSFRECSTELPLDVSIAEADLELFNSSLVAHFVRERTTSLQVYNEVQHVGFKEKAEAELAFRGPGAMLEARRLDLQYVEVTGTTSVRVYSSKEVSERQKIAVLIVATRGAMRSMVSTLWDEPWGKKEEDLQIEREVIWWEIVGPGKLNVHPPVPSFQRLQGFLASSKSANSEDWNRVIAKRLKPVLDRAALMLLVAETPDHIDLANDMVEKAGKINSYTALDIASLESEWSKGDRLSLQDAAVRGRNWLLSRLFDLAAIMPDRIAGKIRHVHYQALRELSLASVPDPRFAKDYLALNKETQEFHVANAVFQDQAVGMERMMTFLACLSEGRGSDFGRRERLEVLEEGLDRMGIDSETLKGMDVGKAFHYLFQGFSMPAALRARERDFLASISSGDPEVLNLVRTLQSSFGTASLEPRAACEVALVPDDILLGQPATEAPMMVVASRPRREVLMADATVGVPDDITKLPGMLNPDVAIGTREVEVPDATASEPASVASLNEELFRRASEAKERARIALTDAITAKGSRHTERKLRQGHERSDRGNELLRSSRDRESLLEAIKLFEKAEEIYIEAKEVSWRKEHSKPKLRVH